MLVKQVKQGSAGACEAKVHEITAMFVEVILIMEPRLDWVGRAVEWSATFEMNSSGKERARCKLPLATGQKQIQQDLEEPRQAPTIVATVTTI
jgi:hypothetical protein